MIEPVDGLHDAVPCQGQRVLLARGQPLERLQPKVALVAPIAQGHGAGPECLDQRFDIGKSQARAAVFIGNQRIEEA